MFIMTQVSPMRTLLSMSLQCDGLDVPTCIGHVAPVAFVFFFSYSADYRCGNASSRIEDTFCIHALALPGVQTRSILFHS